MSQKLYCPECNAYLMAGDGGCHDCSCGWRQYVPNEPVCECDIRTKLVGDGCAVCNPERYEEEE